MLFDPIAQSLISPTHIARFTFAFKFVNNTYSHPLTKSLYLLLHQVVLFTNLNANVDLAIWVELIRDWVIGPNNMFVAITSTKTTTREQFEKVKDKTQTEKCHLET